MPNGEKTFKFKGRTYGRESIFLASEARDMTYKAFGKEASLLGKLVKLGFIVQGGVVFHPDEWQPLPKDQKDGYHSCTHTTLKGSLRLGRIESIEKRR